jgi:hypothetical protein
MDCKVIIDREGFKSDGIYIGRPSIWGNPYAVKRSKYSKRIYSLKESLRLYRKYFLRRLMEDKDFREKFCELVEKLRKDKVIKLNCFCTNKVIKSYREVDLENCKCHGEMIAYFLLKCVEEDVKFWYDIFD